MTKASFRTALAFLPLLAGLPLAAQASTFAEIVNGQIVPLGNAVIALLYALAFIAFLIGLVRLFFSSNEEARQNGRQFAIWGIVGLFVLFAVWGLVRVLLGVLTSFNTLSTGSMQKLTSIITDFIAFLNGTLVPLVFAIAFIVFLWGVFRYFIAGADNPEKRDSGRQFVVYGIVGFFLMLSVWGLVNLLMGTFNLDTNGRPCLPTFGTDANCTGGTAGSQNEPLQPGTNLPGIY